MNYIKSFLFPNISIEIIKLNSRDLLFLLFNMVVLMFVGLFLCVFSMLYIVCQNVKMSKLKLHDDENDKTDTKCKKVNDTAKTTSTSYQIIQPSPSAPFTPTTWRSNLSPLCSTCSIPQLRTCFSIVRLVAENWTRSIDLMKELFTCCFQSRILCCLTRRKCRRALT